MDKPVDIEYILDLPSTDICIPEELPEISGVYAVVGCPMGTPEPEILYVGRASNLLRRWTNGHSFYQRTYGQSWGRGGTPRIHYLGLIHGDTLKTIEELWLSCFCPPYNRGPANANGNLFEYARHLTDKIPGELLYGYADANKAQAYVEKILAVQAS